MGFAWGMNTETWLEKAERLRGELTRLHAAEVNEFMAPALADHEARERITIAHWLRSEFSDEPPVDNATLALFPESALQA